MVLRPPLVALLQFTLPPCDLFPPPPHSACFSRIHKECGPDFKKDSFYGAEILVPFHVIFLFLDVKRKLSPRREQGVQLQVRELRSALGGGYLRGTLTAAQTMAERGAPHPQVLSLWVFFKTLGCV